MNTKKISFIITKIFSIIKKLLLSKIEITEPKKADILVWGTPGFIHIFKEKNYRFMNYKKINFLKVWGESYNLRVLIKCALSFKFSFLDYTNEFIKITKPKVILSFLDNYKTFYLIKKNKNQKKIIIQNSMRSNEFDEFKKDKAFYKNKVDYVFAYNKNIKKSYNDLLHSKTFSVGSFLSNNSPIKKNKKIYDIVYISTFRDGDKNFIINDKITLGDYLNSEKKLIKNILKFSKEYKKKFYILCTNKTHQREKEIKFFNNVLGKKNWKQIKRKSDDYRFTYKVVDKAKIIMGIDTTVLYESLARGTKTVFCDIRPSNKFLDKTRYFGWPKKFKKHGPFWTSNNNYYSIKKVMKNILNTNENNWKKIKEKYADDLMSYDQGNKAFKKILKESLI